ncbi:ATP-binding protein [Chloroflexota bacterium]
MEDTNGNLSINASPTKEFFISMLVKDIELVRSIIDLVDNSVDGARQIRDDDYTGLAIRIEFTKDYFKISDNCGGIPVDIARNYAFRFGRHDNAQSIPHSIGLFGVGMKRTIFKLGRKFKVESTTATSHFVIEEDIEDWKTKKEWTFDFEELEEELPETPEDQRGTIITVTDLHSSVSDDFELENFGIRLAREIEDAHISNLEKNLVITLDSVPLTAHPLHLLQSDILKPAYKETILEEQNLPQIKVKIYTGVSEPNPSTAGWYVFCNGRLILKADRSRMTGWGEKKAKTIPNYHNDYARFRGFVFFESDDAKLLPWNTTKTGVDADSPRFRAIRSEMILLMRPVIDFLRKFRKEKSTDDDERPLELSVEQAKPARIHEISVQSTFQAPKPTSSTRRRPKMPVIQYRKPVEEIRCIQQVLGVSTHKEVGEKTFEYFLERECDD